MAEIKNHAILGALRSLPNVLTLMRLALAVPFFYFLTKLPERADLALAIFVAACLTDVLDGFLARKFGGQSVLGRLMDPAMDKILVCGAFVFLVRDPVEIPAWVAVVILARELGVTALRAVAEAQGHPYPGTISGKVKMVTESCTIAYIVFYAGHLQNVAGLEWSRDMLWVMVTLTLIAVIGSGLQHVVKSLRLILTPRVAK